MFPILFQIGPFTFHTYGLLVALGVILGFQVLLHLAKSEGRRTHETEESLYRLLFFLVLGGILGARTFFVFLEWKNFESDILSIFKVWSGGLVSYGGLVGSGIGFWIWSRNQKIFSWKRVCDWLAPSFALGHALGRLGCFSAGCCYGIPTQKPWGVRFTHPDSLAPMVIPLHPTQLYEFIFLLILGPYLLWRVYRTRENKGSEGRVFLEYLLIYSLGRFGVEFFRDQPIFWRLTTGQWMSLSVVGIVLFFGTIACHANEDTDRR